jgi:peptide/nickel transport system permease protein
VGGVVTALLARRLGFSALVLLVISVAVFAMTTALPGDAAQALLGREAAADPERLAALRHALRLDEGPVRRYLHWVGGLVTGDLGLSAANQEPVAVLLGDRLVNSLVLMAVAALLAAPLALAVGTVCALRAGRVLDHVTSTLTLALAALPEFVIGIGLVLLLSTAVFPILPAVALVDPTRPVWTQPEVLVLPALTLALAVGPYLTRMVRASMLEVLDGEYVQMARLKGAGEWRVVLRHALPNALGPVTQVLALQLAWLTGGAVVVEYLFRYPGVGAQLVDSVASRDVPVVQAVVLGIATLYLLLNLLADVAGILSDARARTSLS